MLKSLATVYKLTRYRPHELSVLYYVCTVAALYPCNHVIFAVRGDGNWVGMFLVVFARLDSRVYGVMAHFYGFFFM